jgi:hypothetical protein
MRFSILVGSAAALCAAAVALGQSAVLHDGRVVTMVVPQELFSVEGPMWNIDVAKRQIICTGHRVTIPASLNGQPFTVGNTQIVNNEEVSLGEITAATFDRLLDANAASRDRIFDTAGAAGAIRLGPTRSLFSTSEARGAAVADLVRTPVTEKQIEDNFFFQARNAFAQYPPGILPASFLGMIGIRTETGDFPANNSQLPPRRFWRYPSMSGATFIADGSVYQDQQGNRFNIPDFVVKGHLAHVVLAENIVIGNIRAAALGNFQTPDSMVVGETMVLMNQDPRMPMSILGIAGSPVSREYLMTQVPAGTFVAVTGHMIGEHVMMGEFIDVTTDVYDPAAGPWMSAIPGSWRYSPGRGVSYRGELVPADSTSLSVQYGNTVDGVWTPTSVEISIQNQLTVDPVLNSATFQIRDQVGGDPAAAREIKFFIRDPSTAALLREFHYNWAAILGL